MESPRFLTRREFATRAATAAAALATVSPSLLAQTLVEKRFKIIGFTKPFQKLNFEDTADTVAEIGWDGIECPVRPTGQIEPERAPDELPTLVEALKRRGKELTLLATAITSVSQPHTEQLLRTAAKLGVRRYRLGSWKYDGGKSIPDQLVEVGAQLRDLAALNKELGLQAGFQNHSGRDYVGAPVWDLWTMMKDFDPRHMGVCFDIGHATIEGGLSWPTEARLMESRLTAVFVKDFVWQCSDKGWRDQWVPLGDGMVDKSFFKWLKTTSFTGPISQHHEYDHGEGRPMIVKMQKNLKLLREWLAA
ncbi:MAG: sugar phosphate isomerase/epimerase [Verrucomicrobiales bacterium]|nr:sugar phosphate isomerase/epimerase [Verrucomicrobiales bacterium]